MSVCSNRNVSNWFLRLLIATPASANIRAIIYNVTLRWVASAAVLKIQISRIPLQPLDSGCQRIVINQVLLIAVSLCLVIVAIIVRFVVRLWICLVVRYQVVQLICETKINRPSKACLLLITLEIKNLSSWLDKFKYCQTFLLGTIIRNSLNLKHSNIASTYQYNNSSIIVCSVLKLFWFYLTITVIPYLQVLELINFNIYLFVVF